VRLFVERCRQKGLAPFISLRMNDCHYLHLVNDKENFTQSANEAICKFYAEHPEWWLSTAIWKNGMNWAVPEVRDYRFALIEELCSNYDLDGIEMDFMRFPNYFKPGEIPHEKQVEIMTRFIARVRAVLDRTSTDGRHRWLCVRVPMLVHRCEPLGIDLRRAVDAGVDMLNLSAFYYTEQQSDLARIKQAVPEASVYLEMCHSTTQGEKKSESWGDSLDYRRTTAEQYYTGAHLAYSRGGSGVSLFNFVYYREHGASNRGPFDEPPFDVLEHLGDPEWLARQPQHYVVTGEKTSQRWTPHALALGESVAWRIDMAPPTGGWTRGGRLRLQSNAPLGDARLVVKLNGRELEPTGDVSEPYPNPYPALLGTPETLRAWTAPARLLEDGVNRIEATLAVGEEAQIIFADLAVA